MKTSLLENLRIARDRAELVLDGQPICVRGDSRSPALTALVELHQHALADYHVHFAHVVRHSGVFARLGSWLGRFWRNRTAIVSPSAPHYSSVAAPPISTATTLAQTSGSGVSQFGPDSLSAVNTTGSPQLRTLFADDHGVHVIWQQAKAHSEYAAMTAARTPIQLTYSLDSDFAHRMRRCFEELSILGHKVTGVELLSGPSHSPTPKLQPNAPVHAAPPAAPREPSSANVDAMPRPESASDVKNTVPVSTMSGESKSASPTRQPLNTAAVNDSSAVASGVEIVMRLHPPSADQPNRALVSAADGGEKPEVLIAPERVLRALHAAAQASNPAAERLTHLRCSRGEKGLRIVAVGFGETAEHIPARWEDAKKWWSDAGQRLAANGTFEGTPQNGTLADKLGPTFATGTAPLQQHREPTAPPRGNAPKSDLPAPEPG